MILRYRFNTLNIKFLFPFLFFFSYFMVIFVVLPLTLIFVVGILIILNLSSSVIYYHTGTSIVQVLVLFAKAYKSCIMYGCYNTIYSDFIIADDNYGLHVWEEPSKWSWRTCSFPLLYIILSNILITYDRKMASSPSFYVLKN